MTTEALKRNAKMEEAIAKAEALAARMGEGWEPVVHENMGWHYHIRKGVAKVYEYVYPTGTKYSAWFEPFGLSIGRTKTQFITDASTPEEALGLAIHEARTFAQNLTASLNDFANL